MPLRNSKVVNQSSTLQNASTSVLFNARRDDEDAHCFVSSDGVNASSVTLPGEHVAGISWNIRHLRDFHSRACTN